MREQEVYPKEFFAGSDWVSSGIKAAEMFANEFSLSGFCEIPSLISARGLQSLIRSAMDHQYLAHRSEEQVNLFLEAPNTVDRLAHTDEIRSIMDLFLLRVVAYDQLREDSPLKKLYLNASLLQLVREITGESRLERFGDELGAVNLTFMAEGDRIPWHFDHSGFVLSIPLTRPESGGEFEIVVKSAEDREVIGRAVLGGSNKGVARFAVEPGSAILFNGRRCLHRVRTVEGREPRTVLLFGYDVDPELQARAESNLGRYGRNP